jgi:hypothetical protein
MRLNAVMEEVIAREQLKEDIMKTRIRWYKRYR